MKVIIHIYGEGDFKTDTLETRLVPVFCENLKKNFEKNGVPTIIIQSNKMAPKSDGRRWEENRK